MLIAQRWAERKRHILVITPANLRKQWHQELADKFCVAATNLDSFRELAVSITENAKGLAPLQALKVAFERLLELGAPQKTIIFTESRMLAQILERDALRWFRPVQGQFNIYYRRGTDQPEYVPDFVAATTATNLLIETKKAIDMNSDDVTAKAEAARQRCAHASDYSAKHGGKHWHYLLVPHDAVQVNATLESLATRFALSDVNQRRLSLSDRTAE